MKNYNIIRYAFAMVVFLMGTMVVNAQQSAVKKVNESVFTLTTFKKDGSILSSSHGVFVGSNGEAISCLKPFIGAASAIVIDNKGNKRQVLRMSGANDIYDVAKFIVDGKTKPADVTSTSAVAGTQLWLIPYSNKSAKPIAATVKSVETFMDKYSYYIFSLNVPENTEGCPFVNDKGQVLGIMQSSIASSDINATDINYIMSLTISGLSAVDNTFSKIGIPMVLPEDKEQAMLTLMLIGQSNDSIKYAATANDFIKMYPNLTDGYTAKAQLAIGAHNFNEARDCMETAIKNVTAKDDAHYNYAKLIYIKEIYNSDVEYKPWNMDKALEEVTIAYSINPLSLYKDLEGQILFAKGDYSKAYNTFIDLTHSNIKSGNIFYNAALCKQQMKAADSEIIALLDSAVNNADTLNLREAAKYFLMRADTYNKIEKYRQAVFDYTRYEVLSGRNVNANFYYIKEQAEVKAKLFKQALTDIDNAIFLAPKEPTFQAEKASLQLRLNMFSEAIETSKKCIEIAPDFSDTYLILGLAQIKTGNKTEGAANLKKAKDMGNIQAQTLIDKYLK